MRVSMKGDYGVRALVELALHFGEGPVQSATIAARQSIPERSGRMCRADPAGFTGRRVRPLGESPRLSRLFSGLTAAGGSGPALAMKPSTPFRTR